jgi:hypothetical protein
MKTEIEFLESIIENCNCLTTSAFIDRRIYELKMHQRNTETELESLKNIEKQLEIYKVFKNKLLDELSGIQYQYVNNLRDDKSVIDIESFLKEIKQILQEKE